MIKILNWLFGIEYCMLRTMNDGFKTVRARFYGDKMYAAPYLNDTTRELLPNGEIHAGGYVLEWRPITKKTMMFFYKGETK